MRTRRHKRLQGGGYDLFIPALKLYNTVVEGFYKNVKRTEVPRGKLFPVDQMTGRDLLQMMSRVNERVDNMAEEIRVVNEELTQEAEEGAAAAAAAAQRVREEEEVRQREVDRLTAGAVAAVAAVEEHVQELVSASAAAASAVPSSAAAAAASAKPNPAAAASAKPNPAAAASAKPNPATAARPAAAASSRPKPSSKGRPAAAAAAAPQPKIDSLSAQLARLEMRIKGIRREQTQAEKVQKAKETEQELLAEAEDNRQRLVAREQREAESAERRRKQKEEDDAAAAKLKANEEARAKRRQEEEEATKAAKAAAEAERLLQEAQEKARRAKEEADRLEADRIRALEETERLAREQQQAAMKALAAAQAQASMVRIQQMLIEKALVQVDAEEDAIEKKTITNYEAYVQSKTSLLRNAEVQNLIFHILRRFQTDLYTVQRFKNLLKFGITPDLLPLFDNYKEMKKHLFKFFVKGGAAPVLLNNLRTPEGTFAFTNDIDAIILINPALSAYNYTRLHANLVQVCIAIINEEVQAGAFTGEQRARIISQFGASTALYPTIDSYTKDYASGAIMRPPTFELGQLPQITEQIPNWQIQSFPFTSQMRFRELEAVNIYEALSRDIVAYTAENVALVKQLTELKEPAEDAVKELQTKIAEKTQKIANAERQKAEQFAYYNSVKNSVALTKSQFDKLLLTYKINLNHGFPIVNPGGMPFKYLNETLIAIKPNGTKHYRTELLDIVIPLQSNPFIVDDWNYVSLVFGGISGLGFDVADIPYTLFNQNRAAHGSKDIPHLAAKYESREMRRKYLKSVIQQTLKNNVSKNNPTRAAITRIQSKMPEANFKRIYLNKEGGRRRTQRQRQRRSSSSSSRKN
jgi:hypothetical protein